MEFKSVGIMTFPTEWKVIEFHGSKPPTRIRVVFLVIFWWYLVMVIGSHRPNSWNKISLPTASSWSKNSCGIKQFFRMHPRFRTSLGPVWNFWLELPWQIWHFLPRRLYLPASPFVTRLSLDQKVAPVPISKGTNTVGSWLLPW